MSVYVLGCVGLDWIYSCNYAVHEFFIVGRFKVLDHIPFVVHSFFIIKYFGDFLEGWRGVWCSLCKNRFYV